MLFRSKSPQSSPFLFGTLAKFEHHMQHPVPRQAAFCAFGAVADGGEAALGVDGFRPDHHAGTRQAYAAMIRTRILAIACGYEDCIGLDILRHDPPHPGKLVKDYFLWYYGTPEVMDMLEDYDCDYILGLPGNKRLTELSRPWYDDVATRRVSGKIRGE